jgi:hypothetical protein
MTFRRSRWNVTLWYRLTVHSWQRYPDAYYRLHQVMHRIPRSVYQLPKIITSSMASRSHQLSLTSLRGKYSLHFNHRLLQRGRCPRSQLSLPYSLLMSGVFVIVDDQDPNIRYSGWSPRPGALMLSPIALLHLTIRAAENQFQFAGTMTAPGGLGSTASYQFDGES